MINWKKLAVALAASTVLLSGCTQSNIVAPTSGTVEGDGVPDVEVDENIPIDWLEVREDLRDTFLDPYGTYADFVLDLDARYDEETDLLTVLIPVTHKTTGADAIPYAQDVLKVIGSSVAARMIPIMEASLTIMTCASRFSIMMMKAMRARIL